jgi:hypothetical protein
MTDAVPPQLAPSIRIDRLVLDIPGLDAARGRALALGIAEGLAKAGAGGVKGDRAAVSVPLAATDGATDDLAAKIVAALLERLA